MQRLRVTEISLKQVFFRIRPFKKLVSNETDEIFIVKFISAHNLRQGCQIVNIDVLLYRSFQYNCSEVPFNGSGNCFRIKIGQLHKKLLTKNCFHQNSKAPQ